MKRIHIHEIECSNPLDISTSEVELEKMSEFHFIDVMNWPAFPYIPGVKFKMAYCNEVIFLKFYVHEESIRATCSRINDPVYTDSCVEFFISTEAGSPYYNFEFNCIGVPKVSYGYSRSDRVPLDPEILKAIQTKSSLGNQPFEERAGGHDWEMMIAIPGSCFCHDQNLQWKGLKARANLYKCGDATLRPHYVTWNPVQTDKPDFHQPAYFGEIWFD